MSVAVWIAVGTAIFCALFASRPRKGTPAEKKENPAIWYRTLEENEIGRELFRKFKRHQTGTRCWRKENGRWVIKDTPFTDDWSEEDYKVLMDCLKDTLEKGGLVYAAFVEGSLKGFVAVLPEIFGGEHRYMDLAAIHVSEDMRNQGIGTALFQTAKKWAKEKGARKLYISAHSSVESQAFYKKMGCVEAKQYNQKHVDKEPTDCQLEVEL